jgi:6,7-dimethyl-8-ribityllumazine synthase
VSDHDDEGWPGEPGAPAAVEEDTGEELPAATDVEDLTGPEPEEAPPAGHAPGKLDIPDDVDLIEGTPHGTRKRIAIVLSRFNGDITNRMLESAFAEIERMGIEREHVTVMPVPGAFELPIGAMALAKTRRYVAVVALGCVIRGETAHFEYVAGEAASGLQLAALETGVPVAFGVLTVDTLEQAMDRIDKGADAVRTALEMADLFSQLRETAARK